jgi:hypothetical protein
MYAYIKDLRADLRTGRNIELYATIALAISIATLHAFHIVKIEIVCAALLATLALIANSLIGIRRTLSSLRNPSSLRDVFHMRRDAPSVDGLIRQARSLDICGMSLLSITTQHRDLLLDILRKGCRVRLLLLDPRDAGLMQLVSGFVTSMTARTHADAVRSSLEALTTDPVFSSSNLEVRTYGNPLAHGLMIIDAGTEDARIRVELYMAKRMPASAPGFFVCKATDPAWYDVFEEEFAEIWERAKKEPKVMPTQNVTV